MKTKKKDIRQDIEDTRVYAIFYNNYIVIFLSLGWLLKSHFLSHHFFLPAKSNNSTSNNYYEH